MSAIVLLDTSVYLNILDIKGFNQNRRQIFVEFRNKINANDTFLLPMATIWETGNHIAHLPDGGLRRKYAEILVKDVEKAFDVEGKPPYTPTYFPDRNVFLRWLKEFPDYAQKNKSEEKTREGISLADLSIIKEWEDTRKKHSTRQVQIWSLDSDLAAYNGTAP